MKFSATNSRTKVLLKSVRLEHFFGFGQNFRKSRRPNSAPKVGRRLEQRWPYYFLQEWPIKKPRETETEGFFSRNLKFFTSEVLQNENQVNFRVGRLVFFFCNVYFEGHFETRFQFAGSHGMELKSISKTFGYLPATPPKSFVWTCSNI